MNFRVTGTPGCLTIGLASQRAGSITDQPPIIPRPAPSTRETDKRSRGSAGDDAVEVARQHLQCRVRSPDHATECNEDAAAVECRLDLGKDFRRDRATGWRDLEAVHSGAERWVKRGHLDRHIAPHTGTMHVV